MPSIELMCREVNDNGLDPLEVGDLRTVVLWNMNHHNMQVGTTVLADM